jgi:hypothetical protein
VRAQWVTITFNRVCLTNALDSTGRLPVELEAVGCVYQPFTTSDNWVQFQAPPGVGRDKALIVTIYSNKVPLSYSNSLNVSYAPPTINVSSPPLANAVDRKRHKSLPTLHHTHRSR